VAAYGGQVVLIAYAAGAGVLSPTTAFLCTAAAFGVVGVVTAALGRRRLVREVDLAAVGQNFAYGKWLLGAEASFWLSSQIYPYLAAIAIGVDAAGTLKALVLLLGPLNVALMYVSTAVPIKLAKLGREQGQAAADRELGEIQLRLGLVFVAYGLAVSVFARPLIDLLYGGQYVEHASAVALFAVQYLLFLGLQTLSAALRARRRTPVIFVSYAAASVVAVALALPLMDAFGIEGAALGMLASAGASSLVCWVVYVRTRRHVATAGAGPGVRLGSEATP
jgi:O-antigen/teichoic acid export membrane protein